MATTIINSMSVKPFCSFVISKLLLAVPMRDVVLRKQTTTKRLTAVTAIGVPSARRYVNFRVAQGSARDQHHDTVRCSTYCALTLGGDRRITGTN
jgi:hypothetical protein